MNRLLSTELFEKRFRAVCVSEPSTPTQTASHAPSLGLGGKSGPIILLIGAGFADIDRTWCATRGHERHSRLRRDVHAPEGGLEAGVGGEGRTGTIR